MPHNGRCWEVLGEIEASQLETMQIRNSDKVRHLNTQDNCKD